MKQRKEREYVYIVDVRNDAGWTQQQVTATSMVDVSRQLKRKLEDLRYVTKVRL